MPLDVLEPEGAVTPSPRVVDVVLRRHRVVMLAEDPPEHRVDLRVRVAGVNQLEEDDEILVVVPLPRGAPVDQHLHGVRLFIESVNSVLYSRFPIRFVVARCMLFLVLFLSPHSIRPANSSPLRRFRRTLRRT